MTGQQPPNGDTLDLSASHLHLEGPSAVLISDARQFWADLMAGNPQNPDAARVAKGGGWLVALFPMTQDTDHWEIHPNGDEVLLMVSGAMDVVLDEAGAERTVPVDEGAAFIVPRGAWHRLVLRVPGAMLALTYGEGTQGRPV